MCTRTTYCPSHEDPEFIDHAYITYIHVLVQTNVWGSTTATSPRAYLELGQSSHAAFDITSVHEIIQLSEKNRSIHPDSSMNDFLLTVRSVRLYRQFVRYQYYLYQVGCKRRFRCSNLQDREIRLIDVLLFRSLAWDYETWIRLSSEVLDSIILKKHNNIILNVVYSIQVLPTGSTLPVGTAPGTVAVQDTSTKQVRPWKEYYYI